MTEPIKNMHAAIAHALETAPTTEVLAALTGAFVGLVTEMMRRQGHDANKSISLVGGNREITIHPPKGAPNE